MQEIYEDAGIQLLESMETVVTTLRTQLENQNLKIKDVAKESMAVEIVSFLLVKCLTDERMAFVVPHDEQAARARAMEIVKAGVIQYRAGNLVPSQSKSK